MMRIPRRYVPLTYGVIQAAITTGVASAIATFQTAGLDWAALTSWLWAWGISWLMMLPVVVLVAPFIQRLVMSMAQP
jgi:hypothetical protein